MAEPESSRPTARTLVMIYCVLFLGFGVLCLLAPARIAQAVEIQLESPSAFADFRAMYGGLSFAIGLLLLQGLRHRGWFAPSLFLTLATSAGLGGARVYSIVVSGLPNELVLLAGLLAEIIGFTWAFFEYRGLDRSA